MISVINYLISKIINFRDTSYNVVSIDWTINPLEARKILDGKKNAQSNENNRNSTDKAVPRILQACNLCRISYDTRIPYFFKLK